MGSGASKRTGKPTFYWFPVSAPCRAVRMVAKQINVEFDLKVINLMKEEQNEEGFLKVLNNKLIIVC